MLKSIFAIVMVPFKAKKSAKLSQDINKKYDQLIELTQKEIAAIDQFAAKVKADNVKSKCDQWRKTWKMEPTQAQVDMWGR